MRGLHAAAGTRSPGGVDNQAPRDKEMLIGTGRLSPGRRSTSSAEAESNMIGQIRVWDFRRTACGDAVFDLADAPSRDSG
jgi:hypothetical protein